MMILSGEQRYEQTPMLAYCTDILYEPLIKTRILYLDTETTDLAPTIKVDVPEDPKDWTEDDNEKYALALAQFREKLKELRAVQIYLKLVENKQVIDTFSTLLRIPDEVDISEGSFRAHQISKEDLLSAPKFEDCLGDIRELLSNSDCICAYNSDFDRMILNKELHRAIHWKDEDFTEEAFMTQEYMIRPWLDPLVWRRQSKIIRGDKNPFSQNKLDMAAKFYGVSAVAQIKHKKVSLHNAETDVNVLIELTHKMYESGDIPFDFGYCFTAQDNFSRKYYEYRDK